MADNQCNPSTLATNGMLHSGTKLNILGCICAPTGKSVALKNVSMMVMDGPAVVHMINPTKSTTFNIYVPQSLAHFLMCHVSATVK